MGSIIFQAGINRVLLPHTTMMIHDGTFGIYSDSKSSENWAEHSKITRKQMYEIYYERMKVKNPNITLKQIENMCSHDTIFTAEEAIENGLADELIQYVK
jgi:ATP-dependent protease ClpP protease subunit